MTKAAGLVLHIYANAKSRETRGHVLRNAGFHVVEDPGGETATALAVTHQPALILLDLQLPHRDGFQVCRELKQSAEGADVPLLAISAAEAGERACAKAAEYGADACLREPIDPATLMSTVRALIGPPQAVPETKQRDKRADLHGYEGRGGAELILGSITDPLLALDSASRVTYLNAAAERLLARKADTLLGKSVWEEYPDVAGTFIHREYIRAVRDGTPIHSESFCVPLQRWFEVRGFPIRDGGITAYFHDITDRKRAESKLRESQERLRLATENTGLGTWDFDLRTGEAVWSRSDFELLGYEPAPDGRATMEMWRSRIHPEDLERGLEEFDRAKRERGVFQSEHRIIRANDDCIRWLTAFGHFQYDESGGAVRFTGVFLGTC
jgi:PAS domain S-box-containing protein